MALASGLCDGDLIERLNGRAVRGVAEFLAAVDDVGIGTTLELHVVRAHQRRSLQVLSRPALTA